MRHKKKFKTIVINRKTISMFGSLIICGVIIGIIFFCSKTITTSAERTNVAEELYKSALESQLPVERDRNGIKKIVSMVLGFDITLPQSIFLANAIFEPIEDGQSESNIQQGIINGETKPTETPNVEYKIEEAKISKGMAVANETSYEVNAEELSKQDLGFKIEGDGAQVLIVHTHATESFTSSGKETYTQSDSDRSTDKEKNIVKVGEKICQVLNNSGIKTIHDETFHDYPSYNGAYGRSLTTIKNAIAKNPSIKVVLDIHRDGIIRPDGTKLKLTTEIDGKKTAQIMFVVGTNASGLTHDNWKENLKFASKIQEKANELYPTLMRPINLREERFNQHITTGSVIVEVGSNGNTLEEAISGAEDFANALVKVLQNE